jgi:FHA domain
MNDRSMIFSCPKGHESTEADYCSECGTKLEPIAEPVLAEAVFCPECGTARVGEGRYCQACQFDFLPGEPVAVEAEPEPIAPEPAEISVLWVSVQVDPSRVITPNPDNPCPETWTEKLFPLDLAETRVGRRSQNKDTQTEIPIPDSGISRRHLSFLHKEDGSFAVLDQNSTNGTRLNDVELEAGVERLIKPGDQLTIGEWTRLAIRAL